MARILIVEDDPISSRAISVLLNACGYETDRVESGHEALGAVMSAQPDAILLDLNLPGADGASVLEILRTQLGLRQTPVVVWTGVSDQDMARRVVELGASSVVLKGAASGDDVVKAITFAMQATPPANDLARPSSL
jgi:two-component system cell cycle response regulator DivK